MTLAQLRHQYPTFHYKSYAHRLTSEGLVLEFEFELDPTYQFHPTITLFDITATELQKVSPALLDLYVFHIGLVEMLSYWKTTCSPTIAVEGGPLDATQRHWFHTLLIQGLGEFFYVNQIDFTSAEFVTIKSTIASTSPTAHIPLPLPPPPEIKPDDHILIPIGGGKDSAVSLEILKAFTPNLNNLAALHLNPAAANQDTANASGITNQSFIRRQLDPLLFEMNADGFLNGHTPFSALMAFLSTFSAHLHGQQFVAVSNERSSNEGNVLFHNQEINHQYSKSVAFEQDFQKYMAAYFPHAPWYFSPLRPWYELQIARYFAQFPQYHHLFRSCNRGKKTNSWCGECSKCLFAYVILLPFLGVPQMMTIFHKDLLDDGELLSIAQELIGFGEKKPLECVGTTEESLAAFYLSWQWYQEHHQTPPQLLQVIHDRYLAHEAQLETRSQAVLAAWNEQHSVPVSLATYMKSLIVPRKL